MAVGGRKGILGGSAAPSSEPPPTGRPVCTGKSWGAGRRWWEIRWDGRGPSLLSFGGGATARPFQSRRASYSRHLKSPPWQEWSSPTVGLKGPWLLLCLLFTSKAASPHSALFTRTLQMRGPACDFETSVFSLHVLILTPLPPPLVFLYHNAVSQK